MAKKFQDLHKQAKKIEKQSPKIEKQSPKKEPVKAKPPEAKGDLDRLCRIKKEKEGYVLYVNGLKKTIPFENRNHALGEAVCLGKTPDLVRVVKHESNDPKAVYETFTVKVILPVN